VTERSAAVPRPLWFLFFCTGMSGLLLEQSFERWLSTIVGASRMSAAITLALYFVGLAIGARLYPLWTRWLPSGLKLYAALEGAVGVYALILGYFPEPLLSSSTSLIAAVPPGSSGAALIRVVLGALWVLPPTIAMGATFPAVVHALEQTGGPRLTRRMSSLYGANLFGAVCGAGLAPYVFFAFFGIDGTLQLVVGVQLLIVVVALSLARRTDAAPTPAEHPPADPAPVGAPMDTPATSPQGNVVVVVGLAFLSGLVVFAFEVVWIHLIGAAIGMSAFSFSLMLVCVLLGLGLGSAIVSRLGASDAPLPSATLSVALLVAALTGLVSLQLWDDSADLLLALGEGPIGFWRGELSRLLTAVVLVLPSATALGVIYPLLFRIDRFVPERAADVASRMGAANAIGSMIGALGTGFVLLDALGAEWTLRGLLVLIALGAIAPSVAASADPRRRAPVLAAAAVLAVAAVASPPWSYAELLSGTNVYFTPREPLIEPRLLFRGEDNVSGFTTVTEFALRPGGPRMRLLETNGKFQGNDGGEIRAQLGFAFLPSAYARGRERALVIGLGTGMSASVVQATGVRQLDVAELSPTMVEAAAYFEHIHRGLFDLPGVELVVDDGRTHLARTPPDTYDLMSLELSSVWFAGCTNLYSREFYRLAKDRLKRDGVFQQWVQLHHLGRGELLSIVATLRSAFPYVQLHFVGGQGILLASKAPLELDDTHVAQVTERLKTAFAPLAGRLPPLGTAFVKDTVVLDSQDTTRLLTHVIDHELILNTDTNRYLEFWSPRYNLEAVDHVPINLEALLQFADPDEVPTRLQALGFKMAAP
jgi:spermidine synthase